MKSGFFVRARVFLAAAVASLSLTGCANLPSDEQHIDLSGRMYNVAVRFSQTMGRGGIAGVSEDIESCYRESSLGIVKRFALQDCLSYDYAAYVLDRNMAKMFSYRRQRMPYFQDAMASPRWVKYGKLDGFNSPPELSAYFTSTQPMIFNFLRQPGFVLWNPSRLRPPLLNANDTF